MFQTKVLALHQNLLRQVHGNVHFKYSRIIN